MKSSTFRILLIHILIYGSFQISAQTNIDDYWLNNGFTDGQTIYLNSGYFYDDGGYDLYQTGQDWNVIFCSENGNPLTLDFTSFMTDYRGVWPPTTDSYLAYDYMTITTPLTGELVAFNDDTPQFSFTSPDGCISFGFISQITSLRDSGWVAEISADPAPSNNDPCDAIEIPVGNSCSPSFFTNKGAYNTTDLESPSCHDYYGGDVWFTVTVPASGEVKIETLPGSLEYGVMALYSGTCESLSEIDCVSNLSTMPTVILSGRTPGEIIYIRLFGDQAKSGTFGICATDPSAEITGFTGPGGVGDSITNRIWLRADEGLLDESGNPVVDGNSVASWQDQSGNELHLVQATSSSRPVMEESGINNRPTVRFDGGDDNMKAELGNTTAPLNLFSVVRFSLSADESLLAIGDANEDNTFSVARENDARYYSYSYSAKQYGPVLSDNALILNPVHATASEYHNLNIDGVSQTVNDYSAAISTDGSFTLGSSKDDSNYFSGELAEVILFTSRLNTAQSIIVHNYLAAKYGIDISTIDKYAYESSHPNDVAGIGQIDVDNSHSRAQSAGILTIGGADDMDDGEFLHFGHDNADFTTWLSTEVPGVDIQRLQREWRIDTYGGDGPGNVDIAISLGSLPELPSEYDGYNLLIDEDGDFSSGALVYGLMTAGDELVADGVSLSDGAFLAVSCSRSIISFTSDSGSGLESLEHPLVEVSLNYPVSEIIEIPYRISGGTASGDGVDFSLNTSVLVFDPGEQSHNIMPLIIDDSIVEIPDESFTIELYDLPAGIDPGTISQYTYTINDDDILIEIVASDTVTGECSGSSTNLTATVTGQAPFSYSWSPADSLSDPAEASTLAYPSVSTRYYLTVTDALSNSYVDSIDIEVVPAPSKPGITLSGNQEFCQGDSLILQSDSADSYLWSNGQTTREIIIYSEGEYYLQVFDSYGCASPVSDTVSVSVNPLPDQPVVSASGSLEFCEGESVNLFTSGSASYLWSSGATTQGINVSAAGSYSVVVIDENSCLSIESESVNVIVNAIPEKPVISISGDTEFCEGDSVMLTSSAADAFVWSNGETTESIWVKTSGKYAVVVSDINSCISPSSDSVEVIVHSLPEQPVISALDITEFCDGGSVELSATASDSYLWSTGETSQNIIVASAGKYSVRIMDVNSCMSLPSDSVEVIVNENPSKPEILSDGEIEFCEGDSVQLSTASMNGYLWSNGSVEQSQMIYETLELTLMVSDENDCFSEASDPVSVVVYENPAKPEISIEGSTGFCQGESVELTADASDNWLWSEGSTSQSINVSESGNYSVKLINNQGCESEESDIITISVYPVPDQPVISPVGPITLIQGDSVELISSQGDAWLWSNGETGLSIYVKNSGSYTVKVFNSDNCSSIASDPVEVIVNEFYPAPVVSVSGATSFCYGDSVELVCEDAYAYLWSTGQDTKSVWVTESGSYTVITKDGVDRESLSSEALQIEVFPLPEFSFSVMDVSCFGGADGNAIIEIETGEAPYDISWDGIEGGMDKSGLEAGSYEVVISDANNCVGINVVEITQPEAISVEESIVLAKCPDAADGEISLNISGGTSPYQVFWDNGDYGEAIYNLAPGTFEAEITDENNCELDWNVDLGYESELCFDIPTIITPNDDGKNDEWVIEGLELYPDVIVEVFDRWGKRVFYSRGYDQNWDGKMNGKDLPIESYHFVIDLNNGSAAIIGNITIVR